MMSVNSMPPKTELRIASWNIHEGVPVASNGDPAGELVGLLAGTDLAALQEVALTVNGEFSESGLLAARTELSNHTTFSISESAVFSDRRMGLVILSKWPFAEVRRIRLPNPGLRIKSGERLLASHDKGMMAVRVSAPGGEFWFATVHMFPFYLFDRDGRDVTFDKVWHEFAESIDSLADLPILLGGDFNTEHRQLLTGKVSREFSRGVTGTPTYRGIESDDIIYTSEFSLHQTQVISTFSDHDLCICDFALA